MYKYDGKSPSSQNRHQGQLIATFGQLPHLYSDGIGLLTSSLSSGLGNPTVQIVSPRPNISDLVDYLDATVRARGRVTIPTQKVNFLVKLDPPGKPTWWKRLWEDPSKIFPTVRVTIELVQVGISLFPLSNYRHGVLLSHGLEEYIMRLHSKTPCGGDFATVIGSALTIMATKSLENDLGIDGQLDVLLKKSNIMLPMSAEDQQKHFWIVYATFPPEIRKYVIPETRILLDEFKFDKSSLTQNHIGKILAIARYSEAMRVSSGTGFPISLIGHADDRGTEKYNVDLGNRRASEVKDALRKAIDGISPGLSNQFTITAKSFGETKPLIRAKTEVEHGRNRRVEVYLPRPKRLCRRVSLHAVVKRALGLLPRLQSPDQAKRISCLLHKVIKKGVDDRWAGPEIVLDVYNKAQPLGTYSFLLLRDQLTIAGVFGDSVSDAQVLMFLERIDESILRGIGEVTKKIHLLSGAASQGVPLINEMKAMDALRAWMHERVQNDQSIYSCYK
jgi:outer membrane protein OmpA-like peptidoglycan-associated protein